MGGKLENLVLWSVGAAFLIGGPRVFSQQGRTLQHVRPVPQLGYNDISCLTASRDGKYFITGGYDRTVRVTEVETGAQVRAIIAGPGSINELQISPDDRYVVAAGSDSSARIFELKSGVEVKVLSGHSGRVVSVAYSPDGRSVLTGASDRTVRVWDVRTGKTTRTIEAEGEIKSASYAPDGKSILVVTNRSAAIWSVSSTSPPVSMDFLGNDAFRGGVSGGQYSPDGTRIMFFGDAFIDLSEPSTGKLTTLYRADESSEPEAPTTDFETALSAAFLRPALNHVSFSNAGNYLVGTNNNGKTYLWEARSGRLMRVFNGPRGMWAEAAAFSPDDKYIVFGGGSPEGDQKGYVDICAVSSLTCERSYRGHTDQVLALGASVDGRFIATGSSDHTVRLWNSSAGAVRSVLRGFLGPVGFLGMSPNGSQLLAKGNDGYTTLWNMTPGVAELQLKLSKGEASARAVISPQGNLFLVGGEGKEPVRLFDARSGAVLQSYTHSADDLFVAFGPSEKTVFTGGSAHGIREWESHSGRLLRTFGVAKADVESMAISPDGLTLAAGGNDASIQLYDIASGQLTRILGGGESNFLLGMIESLTFSPDGKLLLSAGGDSRARVWDLSTGTLVHTLEGHAGQIYSATFLKDGSLIATGSADTTTRIWRTDNGAELAMMLASDDDGWVVVDPEGRYDSSDPDNTPALTWVTDDLKVIELKQLKDAYYTPNLLAQIVKGERLPEVKGLDLVPAPPEVAVASAYEPGVGRLGLSVTDQGGGVGRLVVSVNDRKVATIEHPVAARADGKHAVSVDLSGATLKPGENNVKVYAFDAGNQIRSHEAVATFSVAAKIKGPIPEPADAMAESYKPQFYGILVGTSKFGNPAMDLQYPAHDAESMETGLEIGAGKLFGKENVHLRLLTTDATGEDDQPTKKNILAAFTDVMKHAKSTDVLLVYLSGHGVNLRTEKDSYYYLTEDARSLEIENNPALRDVSTVSAAELKQWMGAKGMPLKEVLILDTCAAGAANDELLKLVAARDVPPDQRRAIEFLKEATGTVILMGSAADKSSYEASRYGQGLLTYALLDGMRGRSVGGDGDLNVSRWFQNASEDVPQLARSIGGIQKPVIAAPSGVGFPVAMLDKTDEARIPLAKIKPELIHLSCHDSDDNDPLQLAGLVRERLREISRPSSGQASPRGNVDPPIVYHDDMNDGPEDAFTPKIVYSVSAGTVTLRLRVERAGHPPAEERLSLSAGDKQVLANRVADRLVALAANVPKS